MYLTCGRALALCRIGLGVLFLISAWGKVPWFTSGDGLSRAVFGADGQGGMAAGAESFYQPFLLNVVQPNAPLFGQLVAAAEWTIGLSLVFGLLTRVGSLTVMWLTLNYMLLKGLGNAMGTPDRLYFVLGGAYLLGSAGLAWGLDGLWWKHLGSTPITRWLAGIPPEAGKAGRVVPAATCGDRSTDRGLASAPHARTGACPPPYVTVRIASGWRRPPLGGFP